MSDKKTTLGKTSTATNNIVHQKITRHTELFLLFWVDEEDSGRKMFSEAAQTRLKNIKESSWFNDTIHKVHCPPIQAFHEMKNIISFWINKYGGKSKAHIREIGIFSHAALDGPISIHTANNPPVPGYDIQMAIPNGWDSIDFNWTKENAICVFYGCNSGHLDGFSQKISSLNNYKDVTIWGQTSSTYPSFFPDRRITSLSRSLDFDWDFGYTYMVGGNPNEGTLAMTLDAGIPVNPLNFFSNGVFKGASHQGYYNDHRRN
jgi:hypothetical protein